MTTPEHIVVFSHGFGVRFDDRGLLTDIANGLGDHITPYFFDYNAVDEAARTMLVRPFSQQIATLQHVLQQAQQKHLPVSLVCHSQGSLVAALAAPVGLTHVVFLAPPVERGRDYFVKTFTGRPSAVIDYAGISSLPRQDGTTTLVDPGYWPELDAADPIASYNALAASAPLTIIRADQDRLLDPAGYASLSPSIQVIGVEADHNFSGPARPKVIAAVQQALKSSQNPTL